MNAKKSKKVNTDKNEKKGLIKLLMRGDYTDSEPLAQ